MLGYEKVRELLLSDAALIGEDERLYIHTLLRGELWQVYQENKRLRELLKEAILNYEDMWFFKELSETLEELEKNDESI